MTFGLIYPGVLLEELTHWGRVTYICVGNLTIIGPDNGFSPGRRQAIICTNAGILFIEPLGTNLNEILIEILTFPFKKMRLKVSSGKWRPFCLGLNVFVLTVSDTRESSTWSTVNLLLCPDPSSSLNAVCVATKHTNPERTHFTYQTHK